MEKPVCVVWMPEDASLGIVVERMSTIAEAEAYIAKLWENPALRAAVENGDYGIDYPEGMQP